MENTNDGGQSPQTSTPDSNGITDSEYRAATLKHQDLYAKWNALSIEEQDSPSGKELSDEITQNYVIITQYEMLPKTTDDNNTTDIDEVEEEQEQTEEIVEHPEFDYKGKVRLSHFDFDAVDKKEAIKLVKASGIKQHDKDIILNEIKKDKVSNQNGEIIKAIISADHKGEVYSGHSM